MPRGYTLIEFLVVVGILVLAIGTSLAFLTTSLKGSNKANVTAEVKQNGQVIIDSLEKQIRNASSAVDIPASSLPSGGANGIELRYPTGTNSIYIVCYLPSPTDNPTQNGKISVASVALGTSYATPTPYSSVTNNDPVSGVSVSSCNLDVVEPSLGVDAPQNVKISFTLDQGVSAPSRADFEANVPFQTTISLRKY